jgi:hypothetical protein
VWNGSKLVSATKAKGKRLGRPKAILDTKRITALRAQGFGWKWIATELGVRVRTVYRFAGEGSKVQQRIFEPSGIGTGDSRNNSFTRANVAQVLLDTPPSTLHYFPLI